MILHITGKAKDPIFQQLLYGDLCLLGLFCSIRHSVYRVSSKPKKRPVQKKRHPSAWAIRRGRGNAVDREEHDHQGWLGGRLCFINTISVSDELLHYQFLCYEIIQKRQNCCAARAINWPGKKSACLVEMNTSANTTTPLFVGEKANSRARWSEQAQSRDFSAKGKHFPFV